MVANALNWAVGGRIMRAMAVMSRVPNQILAPSVLLVTLLGIHAETASLAALWLALAFGALGYLTRRLGVSVLPFVIAFILAGALETSARQAFSATGGDPLFLFRTPVSIAFMFAAVTILVLLARRKPEAS